MTKEKFMRFYTGTVNEKAASDAYDAIIAALKAENIESPLTIVGALATVRVEVGKAFVPIMEEASGNSYEGRLDLGNFLPGDGVKYKGRGLIQLTGRKNYTKYAERFKVDLICNPNLALDLTTSAKILAAYFKDNKIHFFCDIKDWVKVRKLVNGGTNGLTDFQNIVRQYLAA